MPVLHPRAPRCLTTRKEEELEMDDDAIKNIKHGGEQGAISNAIDSKLWSARKHLEEATHDHMKKLGSRLTTATMLIEDVRRLHQELDALPTPEPPEEDS